MNDRLNQKEVMQLQQALKERGQEPGGIDGIMGPETRQALARFQRQNDLQPTGSLNERTAQQLGLEFSEVEGAPKNGEPGAQGKHGQSSAVHHDKSSSTQSQ